MTFFLSKILPLFVYPLGLALSSMLISIVLLWFNRRRSAMVLLLITVAGLWLSATPAFAHFLLSRLEHPFPPVPAMQQSQADAIVLLGGALGESAVQAAGTVEDVNEADDRLFHAARLYKAAKAAKIIVSGGNVTGATPEAERMTASLVALGVPESAIVLETYSRNTQENALYTQTILAEHGAERVLLVTSAFHMRRALMMFRAIGVEAVPAATDYRVHRPTFGIMNWLPDAKALVKTSMVVKEYLGIWVFRFSALR